MIFPRLRLNVLMFGFLLLAAAPAFAASRDIITAPPSSAEKRVALIIGNAAYKNAAPLTNPPNDARLMAQALTEAGFQIVGGKPLIDGDKAAIERAIRSFGEALQGGAVGLFYYSGHGVQIKGSNYLIPVTADIKTEADVKYELVDAGFVLDEMTTAGNRLNIVILDACRNNPFGGRGLRAVGSGLAQVSAPAGTVISYATQPGNVASDGVGGNSPYTTALAQAIRTPGRSVFDTFNAVGLNVKQATNGQQQPWLATSPIEGDFYFSGTPATASTTMQASGAAELMFWDTIKTSTSPADFEAYLAQYPNGQFSALARSRAASAPATQQPVANPSGTQMIAALGVNPNAIPKTEADLGTSDPQQLWEKAKALGPLLDQVVACTGEYPQGPDVDVRTEGAFRLAALADQPIRRTDSFRTQERGLTILTSRSEGQAPAETSVVMSPFLFLHSYTVSPKSAGYSSVTEMTGLTCDKSLLPLSKGAVRTYSYSQRMQTTDKIAVSDRKFKSDVTLRVTDVVENAKIATKLPFLHLQGADSKNWRVFIVEETTKNTLDAYDPSRDSQRMLFLEGPNIVVKDLSKTLKPGWSITVTQK